MLGLCKLIPDDKGLSYYYTVLLIQSGGCVESNMLMILLVSKKCLAEIMGQLSIYYSRTLFLLYCYCTVLY